MTNKEKAIIMAYTGICMLAGDKFRIFHKYVEDIMGRPIYTHEIGLLADTIKEKAEADFMALCADESSLEIPNKCGHWVKEKKHHKDDFQEFDYWDVRCSECGARKRIGWTNIRHCPMCGAKMAESED